MQGTRVWSLVGKIPHAIGQLSPCPHNYWACAPQQNKPQQWETSALQLESSSPSLQLEKVHTQQQRPSQDKNK